MKRLLSLVVSCLMAVTMMAETTNNPQSVVDLCNRVLGAGASDNFTFVLNTEFNSGAEAFQLSGSAGNITVTANTLSALTTGLNWYLNHSAHVNIAWNNLTQHVTSFPAPTDTEKHVASGKYRWYLNYCTFSYSMAFWDTDRWMKEIDWMALHGVNLSLQAVGIDAVWYQMLTEKHGFTHAAASAWIAGPAHQGWWLMDNLSGMGGPNPAQWYTRQAALGRAIVQRMVELGIEPAIPGFIGMVPTSIAGSNYYSGTWTSGIKCPVVINASEIDTFNGIATHYYDYVRSVFGIEPKFYANDVMHERSLATDMSQTDFAAVCTNTRNAMNAYALYDTDKEPTWVAQMWQDNAQQFRIDALTNTKTLLLDLSSERTTYKGRYGSKEYLFCMLHNYGGNIGMYGCMQKMLTQYSEHLSTGAANGSNGTLVGVGATPEGIDTNPVLYDLLYELPWRSSVPDAQAWLNDYSTARYGVVNTQAQSAWNRLRTTVYSNTDKDQQGCREPVFCARPNLSANNASAWAKASYHWDKTQVITAARELLTLSGSAANTTNYNYDVVDFVRQALTDYAHTLQLDMAKQTYTGARFAAQSDAFLALMDDIDALLATTEDFRLGRWIGAARQITTDTPMTAPDGFTSAADWIEKEARLLLTTWYEANTGGSNGLLEYANREYQGLISDYYKPRWQYYFTQLKAGNSAPTSANYYNKIEHAFVLGATNDNTIYSAPAYGTYAAGEVTGDPVAVASNLMAKYFGTLSNDSIYSPCITRSFPSLKVELSGKNTTQTLAALDAVFTTKTTGTTLTSYAFDLDEDGDFDDETQFTDGSQPNCPSLDARCRITMSDGAQVIVTASVGSGEAPKQVTLNGWTYKCTNVGLTLTLTSVVSGTGECVIPSTTVIDDNTYTIVALANDLFTGNTSVTSIQLPATVTSLGDAVPFTEVTDKTVGSYTTFNIPETLSKDGHWAIKTTIRYGDGSAGFNAWGHVCYQFGWEVANPSSTDNKFQLYQNKASNNSGELHIMPERSSARTVADANTGNSISLLNSTATVISEYNNGEWTHTIRSDKGDLATVSYTAKYGSDIRCVNFSLHSSASVLGVSYHNYDSNNAGFTAKAKGTYAGVASGAGDTSQQGVFNLPFTLTNGEAWTIGLRVDYGGTAFNQWGSSLLASGSGTAFSGYGSFQLYLNAGDKKVVYNNNASNANSGRTITDYPYVTLVHAAGGDTPFYHAANATDRSYVYTRSPNISDFNALSYAIAEGTTLDLTITGAAATAWRENLNIFSGCTALTSITVDDGNPTFSSEDGVLYDAAKGTLLRMPEGTAEEVINIPSTVTVVEPKALNGSTVKIGVSSKQYTVLTGQVDDERIYVLPDPEPELEWTPVGGKDLDGKNQYVTEFIANGTSIYTNNSNLSTTTENATIVIPTTIDVKQGDTFTLSWTGTSLEYTFLSAYFDKNRDGTFQHDAGYSECLGVMGTNGKRNSVLDSNNFTFTVPLSTPLGSNCLRLRFDGAWMSSDGGESASLSEVATTALNPSVTPGNYFPILPDYTTTNRVVYDIHFNVIDKYDEVGYRDGTKQTWYIEQLLVNDNAVYEATEHPGVPYVSVATPVIVYPGKTYKIGWANTTDLQTARLTAFLDWNGDGTFACAKTGASETDYDPETLGIIGDLYSSTNTMMNNFNGFNIDIPETAEIGTSKRLRLRFDYSGEAKNTNYNQTIKVQRLDDVVGYWYPYFPDKPTLGIVYDVDLNIEEYPSYDIIVKDGSLNKTLGSVSVTGLTATDPATGAYTVTKGDEIELVATQLNNDAYFLGWWQTYTETIDVDGVPTEEVVLEKLTTKKKIKVTPDRSGITYFTKFATQVTWNIDATHSVKAAINDDTKPAGYVGDIGGCVTLVGGTDLDLETLTIPDTFVFNDGSNDYTYIITQIDPEFLSGNTSVKTLNINSQYLNSVGSRLQYTLVNTDMVGNGETRITSISANPLQGSDWNLTAKYAGVLPDDILICSGTNPDSDDPNFKVYVDGDGHIHLKSGTANDEELPDIVALDYQWMQFDLRYNSGKLFLSVLTETGVTADLGATGMDSKWTGNTYKVTSLCSRYTSGTTLKNLGYNFITIPTGYTYGPSTYNGTGEDLGHNLDEYIAAYRAEHGAESFPTNWSEMNKLAGSQSNSHVLNLIDDAAAKPMDDTWDFTISATINYAGTHYNAYGSTILATGSNPKADNFTNGFQLYMTGPGHKDGPDHVMVKVGMYDGPVSATTVQSGDTFDFIIEHTANATVDATSTTLYRVLQDGEEIYKLKSNADLSEIFKFCTNIVEGNSLESFTINGSRADVTQLIVNGAALTSINVADANSTFESHDGLLYTKGGELLLRVPNAATGVHNAPETLIEASSRAFDENTGNTLVGVTMPQYALIDNLPAERVCIRLSQEDKGNVTLMQHSDNIKGISFPKVRLTDRTLSESNWNTFCLPFNISASKCAELFSEVRRLDDVVVTKEGDATSVTLSFVAYDMSAGMKAGVPFIVKGKAGTTAEPSYVMEFNSKTFGTPGTRSVSTTTADGTYTVDMNSIFDFRDIYEKDAESNQTFYYIKDNLFKYVAEGAYVRVKGYRAYMVLTQDVAAPAAIRSMGIATGNIPTDVINTVNMTGGRVDVYNLHGQLVRKNVEALSPLDNLPKGVYVIDGKKVIKD